MKKANKKTDKNKHSNYHNRLLLAVIFMSLFLSIGYAQIGNTNLGISGTASILEMKDVFISDSTIDTSSPANVNDSNIALTNLTLMQSKVVLSQNRNSHLSINVTIYNNSGKDVYFNDAVYTSEFYDNSNIDFTLSGLSNGQLLETNDFVTFTITFKYSDTYLATNPTVFDNELNSYINFDFKMGYTITYTGFSSTTGLDTVILEGQTLTETFNSTTGIPYNVNVTGCTSTYSSPTLTLSNPTSDITINRVFSITYTGFTGNTSSLINTVTNTGATITFTSTTGIPTNVTVTGATSTYNSPILVISNVTDNVTITGAVSLPYVYVLNMYDYVLHGNPIPNSITTYNSPSAVMAAFYNQPFYFKHILENNRVVESYIDFIITPEMVQDDGRLTAGTYTLRGGVNESNSANKPVFDANVRVLKEAFGENSGICDFSDPDEVQCYAIYNFQASSDGLVSFYVYVDALSDVVFCSIDQDCDSHCVA